MATTLALLANTAVALAFGSVVTASPRVPNFHDLLKFRENLWAMLSLVADVPTTLQKPGEIISVWPGLDFQLSTSDARWTCGRTAPPANALAVRGWVRA